MRAITRPPGIRLADCELTHLERVPIDLERAREQHRAYQRALRELGAEVVSLAPDDEHPDACFVEDTAVILGDVAVITRPGALSRRAEVEPIAEVLGEWLELRRIEAPGTLDGGDVLHVDRTLFIGITPGGRTNAAGADALRAFASAAGFDARAIPFRGCLHLKTAVSFLGDEAVLIDPACVDPAVFGSLRRIEMDPGDPLRASALRIADTLLVPMSAPGSADRLRRAGYRVQQLDISEFEKAEAGLTCLSLLLD
jgi:dimethylargininase